MGARSTLAADPSAWPDAGKVVLRVGWTNDPDNLNPFIGAETSSYEIWQLNYDFLTGYSLDLQPTPDLAEFVGDLAGRQDWTFHLREGVKWQDGERSHAGDVAFTYNYIVDNEMGAFSSLTNYIEEAVAVDDLTVEIRCSKPKANMLRSWIPDPARSTSGARSSPRGRRRLVPEQAADRRHRALPDGGGQEGRLRAHDRPIPPTGASRSRRSTRSSSSPTRTPTR